MLYEIERSNAEAHSKMLFLLENCWISEQTSATLHEYREKLKFLQKLECTDGLASEIVRGNVNPSIPINYLLGMLYVNFKLLWDPVVKLISSYALSLNSTQFWPIFGPRLKTIGDLIRSNEIDVFPDSHFKCKS